MSKHPNKENDHFDHLIRRKLEEHQAEFDPAAWDAMEKKLEGSGNRGGMAGKITGLLFVSLVLIFSGWWLLKADDREKSAADEVLQEEKAGVTAVSPANSSAANKTSAKEGALPQQAGKPKAAQQNSAAKSGTGNTTGSSGAGNKKDAGEENPAKGFTPGENRIILSIKKGNASAAGSPVANRAMEEGKEEGQNQQALAIRSFPDDRRINGSGTYFPAEVSNSADDTEPVVENKSISSMAKVALIVQGESGQEDNSDKSNIGNLAADKKEIATGSLKRRNPESFYDSNGSLLLPVVPEEEKAEAVGIEQEEEKQEEKEKVKRGFPLSIIAVVSPDFTGTEQKGSVKTGAGAGIFLEYEFLPGWSVLSGAFYSRKNYLAGNIFASSYGSYGEYRPAPDYIDAGCAVIDIPLNLRYYLFNIGRHSIFLSAGASAYIMKREDYTFVYNNSYKYKDYTYSVEGQNKHLPAVYNFSVGYQRSLSRHWSLQAEPFYKLPAKGVGAGVVKLNSMGAFVQLKYSIGR